MELITFTVAASQTRLRVLSVKELLLGRCDATVPGAGAVCPLDAGVMVGLASVYLLLDHQVCPQTLLRGGDLTGQRGTEQNLQRKKIKRSIANYYVISETTLNR